MLCRKCGSKKLSREFPYKPLSPECRHGYTACLRCTVAHYREHGTCYDPRCSQTPDESIIKEFEQTLSIMFTMKTPKLPGSIDQSADSILDVVTMTGQHFQLDDIDLEMTISQIKEKISAEQNYDNDKQMLFYEGVELEHFKRDSRPYRLRDYNIELGSMLNLMILLYDIPKDLNEVVFSLSWTFPPTGRDYLDASCLLIQKNMEMLPIDFRQNFFEAQKNLENFIVHSGDNVLGTDTGASHTIDIILKEIPKHYEYLVFTLSSYKAQTIKAFRNPRLTFSKKGGTENLCSTEITHALDSKAVVMCLVLRHYDTWRIIECGQKCAQGNVTNYEPMKALVNGIIKGMFPGRF